ncbi:hypothetical protein EWM64_g1247 [Hericium alpestre]|uniref:Adenylate cyclase n=1 Tax=Hericium alpestre TaxID=135208 RepID=A0A4Z0A7P8_9AGAM|nr:hypothetical protein EWM64_g1247 [Hericium alpestre]
MSARSDVVEDTSLSTSGGSSSTTSISNFSNTSSIHDAEEAIPEKQSVENVPQMTNWKRPDLRKTKSSNNLLSIIRRSRSKRGTDSDRTTLPDDAPPLPSRKSEEISRSNSGSRHWKRKAKALLYGPPPSPNWDFNLSRMDGVVDPSVLPSPNRTNLVRTPIRTFDAPILSLGYPGTVTYYPLFSWSAADIPQCLNSSVWDPPQSWAVGGKEELPEPEHSDPEEDIFLPPKATRPDSRATSAMLEASRKRVHSRTLSRQFLPERAPITQIQVRVYRAGGGYGLDGSYEILSIPLHATVAELDPVLRKRLTNGDTVAYQLHIREHGRDRLLSVDDRPANILWIRLHVAGFQPVDHAEEWTSMDLECVAIFSYKSAELGNLGNEITFENYDRIDMTNRRMRAIPLALYGHAEEIQTLVLDRNPMLSVPIDFAQMCTRLRELSLSTMAINRVPSGVSHFSELESLDLSCNRIADLEHAGLENLPKLTKLDLKSHRMEKLPESFRKLRSLKVLNASNGKFDTFPSVLCDLPELTDLDISFNTISVLPDTIGRLGKLRRLTLVGNQLSRFPESFSDLSALHTLNANRNRLVDIAPVTRLTSLTHLRIKNNFVRDLEIPSGPCLLSIDASHNLSERAFVRPRLHPHPPLSLTFLDLSHVNLTSLDNLPLADLACLEVLRLDHNRLTVLPDSIEKLGRLISLSCRHNRLRTIPSTIHRLQRLEVLHASSNHLTEIPSNIWNCGLLTELNLTANALEIWHPPLGPADVGASLDLTVPIIEQRKVSVTSLGSTSSYPLRSSVPLVTSLKRLYLGQNKLTDNVLPLLATLSELRVLNMSFNEVYQLPGHFFKDLSRLEELYLSGNHLLTFPTEHLEELFFLRILFLNGNRFHTLPIELSNLTNLTMLDMGSNVLKYNISNTEFDWNWNYNKKLQYLNLSDNKQLEIKPDRETVRPAFQHTDEPLAGFSSKLRVLGLIDVTTTFATDIPEDNKRQRVRTTVSEVNGMVYGIADFPGQREHVCMFDVVQPSFRHKPDEALFAVIGRTRANIGDNVMGRHLYINVTSAIVKELDRCPDDNPTNVLRRSFLGLNKTCYNYLRGISVEKLNDPPGYPTALGNVEEMEGLVPDLESSASQDIKFRSLSCTGVVVYVKGRTLYTANNGNSMAVVSCNGTANLLSCRHDEFDRTEMTRIRAAEGWFSPDEKIADVSTVSRTSYDLTDDDEFIIIANEGVWLNVPVQLAVDIVRSERGDPMRGAQKLRDFAMSYDGDTTIMVMVVAMPRGTRMEELGEDLPSTAMRQPPSPLAYYPPSPHDEVLAPTGHMALVFTDIRNSTHLWETNGSMATAIRLHHALLRQQIRDCGGYQVKTEGDAFVVAFQSVSAALLWCLNVQVELMYQPWPKELLNSKDGMELYDTHGNLIARGLAVRMGLHCGVPVCGPDPVTKRMDYFGPMVNRAARISACAEGGQILLSVDALNEIQSRIPLEKSMSAMPMDSVSKARISACAEEGKVLLKVWELNAVQTSNFTDKRISRRAMPVDPIIEAIRNHNVVVASMGEVKLKNLEVPEVLSSVYPRQLLGRKEADCPLIRALAARSLCTPDHLRELSLLCIRLEAVASKRVFKPQQTLDVEDDIEELGGHDDSRYMYGDPAVLLPAYPETMCLADTVSALEHLLLRLETALSIIDTHFQDMHLASIMETLIQRRGRSLSPDRLQQILNLLST